MSSLVAEADAAVDAELNAKLNATMIEMMELKTAAEAGFAYDMMLERGYPAAWADIRIQNYHRPLSAYMTALLGAGSTLRQFDEPPCTAPDPAVRARFHRMPWALFMVWDKEETPHER